LERILFLLLLFAVSGVVFGGVFSFAYLTVPFLVWAAFRFEQRETATVIALLAGIAVWGTVKGHGPFVGATPNASLIFMQAFMGIMVLVALPLASVVAEREAATKKVRDLHRQVQVHNSVLEERVRERTQELEDAHLEMLERLAVATELRDDDTGQHTKRVAHMAALLARNLGLSNEQVELIRRAAPLHDVGKISVPDHILRKPGTLTPAARRRTAVAAGLAAVQPGVWIDVDTLFAILRAQPGPLAVARSPLAQWRLYLVDSHYGSLGAAGWKAWNVLEGRYALCVLFEYAATLGVVDVAYTDPRGARDDYRDLWGAHRYDRLSRYDGLMAIRVNELGLAILHDPGALPALGLPAPRRGPPYPQ